MASQDKMQVLGLVSLESPKISLRYIPSSEKLEVIRGHILSRLGQTMNKMFVSTPQVIVTYQSRLYSFFDEILDHNNRKKFNHQICRHDQNKYASPDGFSSNRLEAAFSHIKRSWRGIYTRWSRLYNQLYLDEFCFRYNIHSHQRLPSQTELKSFSGVLTLVRLILPNYLRFWNRSLRKSWRNALSGKIYHSYPKINNLSLFSIKLL